MASEPTTRRFTVEEYYRMAEAGILGEDDRVELLDGEIVQMSPIGSRHAACVDRLNHGLQRRVGEAAIVRVQNPIRLSDTSEPQPDLCLLQARADYYTGSHPGPRNVLLVIEVADASLRYDRDIKVPTYARAGIPEVWLVDLDGERLHVFWDPIDGRYRSVREFGIGDVVASHVMPALRIPIDQIQP